MNKASRPYWLAIQSWKRKLWYGIFMLTIYLQNSSAETGVWFNAAGKTRLLSNLSTCICRDIIFTWLLHLPSSSLSKLSQPSFPYTYTSHLLITSPLLSFCVISHVVKLPLWILMDHWNTPLPGSRMLFCNALEEPSK